MANPANIQPVSLTTYMQQIQQRGQMQKQNWNALRWLAKEAPKLRDPLLKGGNIMRGMPEQLVARPTVGRLYLFFYDPKWKLKLPYFDRYPCVFPLSIDSGGMLGLNMHYLDYYSRAMLMEQLRLLANNAQVPENRKLNIAYDILTQSAARYKGFKACIKRYLWGHVRSRFLRVPYDQWTMTIMLPLAQFEKKSGVHIWRESRKKV